MVLFAKILTSAVVIGFMAVEASKNDYFIYAAVYIVPRELENVGNTLVAVAEAIKDSYSEVVRAHGNRVFKSLMKMATELRFGDALPASEASSSQ